MPVSMTGSTSYRGGAPSQRAMDDAARLRARAARLSLNPGPGTYDPKRIGATSDDLAGSSAFKSKSERKKDGSLREVGDPGSYHPHECTTVAYNSSRSFNKSQQTGAGGFGTKVRRAEMHVPNDAPGPGTYDAQLPTSPEAKQSSAFASQTKRNAHLRKAQTPGAGEYDPVEKTGRTTGGDSMFKDKGERFKKRCACPSGAPPARLILMHYVAWSCAPVFGAPQHVARVLGARGTRLLLG